LEEDKTRSLKSEDQPVESRAVGLLAVSSRIYAARGDLSIKQTAMTAMKIENPALVAALEKAAYTLNVSPSKVLETLLSEFVERTQSVPSEYICEFSTCFLHRTQVQAEIAAERIAELAVSDALEGRTELTVNCEVIKAADGFLVSVDQLYPGSGKWRSDEDDFGNDWLSIH
jgi:hypothetical protein